MILNNISYYGFTLFYYIDNGKGSPWTNGEAITVKRGTPYSFILGNTIGYAIEKINAIFYDGNNYDPWGIYYNRSDPLGEFLYTKKKKKKNREIGVTLSPF